MLRLNSVFTPLGWIGVVSSLIVATVAWTQIGTTFEPNIDRFGSDYFGFELPGPQPTLCQQACIGDAQCRAWTYMAPGLQGQQAQCFLKNPAPPPTPSNCCVSGVKGAQPLPQPQPSGATCEQLWVERNSIYKARGYCFKTQRAIAYFGNQGCIYHNEDSIPFTQAERNHIAQVVAQERAMGCN